MANGHALPNVAEGIPKEMNKDFNELKKAPKGGERGQVTRIAKC